VRANGNRLHESLVGGESGQAAWRTVSLDLSALAGTIVNLELIAASHDGRRDAAYWGQVEIISD
jgi:hypothetical protein